MKRLVSTLAAALLVAAAGGPVLAGDKMMSGSVMVNPKTKMYMMPDKAHMQGMKMMCKSKADAMGGKMSTMKGHM